MKATKTILTSFIFAIFLFSFVFSVPAASAAVSHSASQITSGTFPAGNFVFQNNLDVNGNLFANSVLVNSWLYNQTTPANSYTNAVVSANTAAWTSTYNSTYAAYSAYSYNQTAPAQTYADASFVKKSGDTMTGALVTTQLNSSGQTLLATSSGNVGIGTTNPGVALDIKGTSQNQIIVRDPTQSTVLGIRAYYPTVGFNVLNSTVPTTDAAFWISQRLTGSQYLEIDGMPTGTAGRAFSANLIATFHPNGNVGIGTTSPAAKLEINTPVNSAGFYVFSPTLADGNYVYQTMGKSGNANEGFIFLYNHNSADASRYLQIGTNEGWNVGEGIRILGNGNVGIGTTSPGAKLEVSGSEPAIYLTSTRSDPPMSPQTYALTTLARETGGTGHNLAFRDVTSNAVRMSITPAGNVGIGTESPGAKLDVKTNAAYGIAAIFNSTLGGNGMQIKLEGANAGKVWDILTMCGSAGGCNPSDALMIRESENPRITILPTSGNVGIGTTSPETKLTIESNDVNARQLILQEATDPNQELYLGWQSTDDFAGIQAYKQFTGPKNLALQHAGGNVGIGTTNPTEKLQVNGNLLVRTPSHGGISIISPVTASLVIDCDSIGYGYPAILQFAHGGVYKGQLAMEGWNSAPNDRIHIDTATKEAITILQDGKVGINRISPSYQLDVNGALRAGGNLLDSTVTDGETGLFLQRWMAPVDGKAVRVTFGAADSCGAGYRCLRIPNA